MCDAVSCDFDGCFLPEFFSEGVAEGVSHALKFEFEPAFVVFEDVEFHRRVS